MSDDPFKIPSFDDFLKAHGLDGAVGGAGSSSSASTPTSPTSTPSSGTPTTPSSGSSIFGSTDDWLASLGVSSAPKPATSTPRPTTPSTPPATPKTPAKSSFDDEWEQLLSGIGAPKTTPATPPTISTPTPPQSPWGSTSTPATPAWPSTPATPATPKPAAPKPATTPTDSTSLFGTGTGSSIFDTDFSKLFDSAAWQTKLPEWPETPKAPEVPQMPAFPSFPSFPSFEPEPKAAQPEQPVEAAAEPETPVKAVPVVPVEVSEPEPEPEAVAEAEPEPTQPVKAVKAAKVAVVEAAAEDEDATAAEGAPTDDTDVVVEEEEKKRRSPIGIILGLLGVALVVAGVIIAFLALKPEPVPEYHDMDGNVVQPDDTSMNDPEWVDKANLEEVTGARVLVPERGLDYPYGEVNEVNGVINPPNFQGVFRIRTRGVDLDNAQNGTVYLATHALRGIGRAPGNDLSDLENKRSSLIRGMEVVVNGVTYIYDTSFTVSSGSLGERSDLFGDGEMIPGRMLIITCMQSPDGSPPTENLIIVGWLPGFGPWAVQPAPEPEPGPSASPEPGPSASPQPTPTTTP